MQDTKFYFRVSNQRPIFGPYESSDFWKLVSDGRIHESVQLSTAEAGPWLLFRDFLFQGDYTPYFYLPRLEGLPIGPVSKEYLKYLLTCGIVSLTTPISNSADGPWKLIKESSNGPEFRSHFASYPSRSQAHASAPLQPPQKTKSNPSSSFHSAQDFLKETIQNPVNDPNTKPIPDCKGSVATFVSGVILLILATIGSLAGAGKPFEIPAFGLTLLLNPISWLGVWLIYFAMNRVYCPYCQTKHKNFRRNTQHRCEKCGERFNIPA